MRRTNVFLTMALTLTSAMGFSQGYYQGGGYQGDCCPPKDCCDSFLDGFSVDAEVLVWKTSIEDNSWAYRFNQAEINTQVGTNPTIFTRTDVVDQKRKDFNFDFDAGFRVGLGYVIPCSDWNVDLTWTHFYPSQDSSARADLGFTSGESSYSEDVIVPRVSAADDFTDSVFTNAHAKFSIKFDDVWLTTSRKFEFCDSVVLEPFAGFDYLRIHNNLNVHASLDPAFLVDSDHSFGSNFTRQHYKTTYSAPGIIVGFKNRWNFGCGFSFLSQLSGGAAYGKVHSSSKTFFQTSNTANTSFAIEADRTSYHKYVVIPQLNFALGLGWDYCLCGYNFDFFAKWEFNRYFNQNYIWSATNDLNSSAGDLSFQGLTAGFNVRF